jgi:F0F1-type ATP synthase membrane subunit b/b'
MSVEGMQTLIFPLIHFAILFGGLFYLLRDPVRKSFAERHLRIGNDLNETRVRLVAAREKYEEFSGRLRAVEAETQAIRKNLEDDALQMKSKILADVKQNAGVILADAKSATRTLEGKLFANLQESFASVVIQKATEILQAKLTGDDRKRFREVFSRNIGVGTS